MYDTTGFSDVILFKMSQERITMLELVGRSLEFQLESCVDYLELQQ